MPQVERTNGEWLNDIEDRVDELRQLRAELRSQIYDADLEAEELWSESERRWRRLEGKLQKAESAAAGSVNAPRVKNVERLLEAIDDAYHELQLLVD